MSYLNPDSSALGICSLSTGGWRRRYKSVFTAVKTWAYGTGYGNFILPDEPLNQISDRTIQTVRKMFLGTSLFSSSSYQCLKHSKPTTWLKKAWIIDRKGKSFRKGVLTADQFRCVLFLFRLFCQATPANALACYLKSRNGKNEYLNTSWISVNV